MRAIKAIFGVALIVAVVVVLVDVVPPYYSNYQLQDVINDEARMNTYTPKPVEEMRDHVFRKCQELDIPVAREQINVQREGQTVSIWLDYKVHVDLPGYPVDLSFHSSTKNKAY
jgi:hypothetical protein